MVFTRGRTGGSGKLLLKEYSTQLCTMSQPGDLAHSTANTENNTTLCSTLEIAKREQISDICFTKPRVRVGNNGNGRMC